LDAACFGAYYRYDDSFDYEGHYAWIKELFANKKIAIVAGEGVFEKLDYNMELTILISFAVASICFMLVYICHQPIYNIIFLILAIFSSGCAASIMWSRYCPSLRDTGMVSSATGFLDFVSYMAASISSTVFANAVSTVGWGNLILIWFVLMVIGIFVAFPFKQRA
jgi:hypothetical protein